MAGPNTKKKAVPLRKRGKNEKDAQKHARAAARHQFWGARWAEYRKKR